MPLPVALLPPYNLLLLLPSSTQSPDILNRGPGIGFVASAGFFSSAPEYAAARRASIAARSARSFANASSFALANAVSVGFIYPEPSRLRKGHDISCLVPRTQKIRFL
jgi:hypothetical protein